MSMPAIERVIPLVGQLPASIRDALARRVARTRRPRPDRPVRRGGGRADDVVGAGPEPEPRDLARRSATLSAIPARSAPISLMQILGLGAIMLILPVAVWGWRMLTHRTFDREALRLGCWILCTVIAAGFASCWPHGGAWPLPTGLGGVVGDALVRAPAVVFGPAGFVYRLVLGIILFAAMLRDLPVRERLGLASARRRTDADRGRRHAVRRRRRSQLGVAGLGVSRADEHQGAARLAARHRLSLAGRERAAAPHLVL